MTIKANTTNSNFRSKTFLTLLFLFSVSFNASASIIYELSTDDIADWEGEYRYYDFSEDVDVEIFGVVCTRAAGSKNCRYAKPHVSFLSTHTYQCLSCMKAV